MRSPRFEPGSSAWQADVLDQTRLRPHEHVFSGLRYCGDAKCLNGYLSFLNRLTPSLPIAYGKPASTSALQLDRLQLQGFNMKKIKR